VRTVGLLAVLAVDDNAVLTGPFFSLLTGCVSRRYDWTGPLGADHVFPSVLK